MDERQDIKPDATKYLLENLDKQMWARLYIPRRRYGLLSDNIIESANSNYFPEREMLKLPGQDSIWNKQMDKRHERTEKAMALVTREVEYTQHGKTLLKNRLDWGIRNSVTTISQAIARVRQVNEGKMLIVHLEKRKPTCTRFNDFHAPCGNSVTAIRKLEAASKQYMLHYLSTANYLATYRYAIMLPVDLDDCASCQTSI
ncbi:hypothetical protein EDC01DRAFT_635800 [Geopyxis carbonaria]|nr:hypothetical protein EDC01DRAFT_635800 [Geopyxis carbonaria]